jgi:hypothetical protein
MVSLLHAMIPKLGCFDLHPRCSPRLAEASGHRSDLMGTRVQMSFHHLHLIDRLRDGPRAQAAVPLSRSAGALLLALDDFVVA